jgi:transposase
VSVIGRCNSAAKAGRDPEVVLEATYGWYWAADLLQACGARVHLAHPLGVKMFGYQRARDRRPRLQEPG